MNKKRVDLWRSNRIKRNNLSLSTGIRAIHHLCRFRWIVQSFSFSVPENFGWDGVEVDADAVAVRAFADAALTGQVSVRWPVPPQNMQRFLSIRRCRSCWVSFPWESSLPVRSTRGAAEGLKFFGLEAWWVGTDGLEPDEEAGVLVDEEVGVFEVDWPRW